MRGGCFLLFVCIGCLKFGFDEFRLARSSQSAPTVYHVAQVESGKEKITNCYATLDKHIALTPYLVFSYDQKKGGGGEPGPETRLNYCYYPAVSADNPDLPRIAKALEDSDAKELPKLGNVTFLVKTKQWSTLGSIPDTIPERENVTGLIVTEVESLDSDEKRLLAEGFTGIDTDKLLILEEGREPHGYAFSLALMAFGGLGLVALAASAIRSRS